ncbi:MAG: tail fiber domain-containing protein [Myxococcales bacterium]|nr:tail fiber domain-containing protein [Myxococcales bacterium]
MGAARQDLGGLQGLAGSQYHQDRRGMASALAGLQGLADGTGPSLAQQQLQNATDSNIAQTMAAMGSARGGNLNATQMGAATAGIGMRQDANKAMAELRAQEQINALGAAGGLASTMAGMSSGREMGFAGMDQNLLAQQYGMANERELARGNMLANRLGQRQQNAMGWANYGMNAAGQVLGGAAAFSDERVKEDIRERPSIGKALASLGQPASEDGDEDPDGDAPDLVGMFSAGERKGASKEVGKLRTYSFHYDDRAKALGAPEGELVGVMAQELERAGPRGKAAVYEHEAGPKALHPAKSIGLALAASADHEGRLRELEKRLGGG